MQNFDELDLSATLKKSLAYMKFSKPTPIQAQAIPVALKGRDIMGSAQTGTGKTAAFAIPLIENLLTSRDGKALVMAPTREIGKQIMDVMIQLLGPKNHIKTAFIIGGEPMGKQFNQLRANPRLVVGTPGRINDHLERGSLDLSDTSFLVLDETDRMLDMGFMIQLETIFQAMPQERQTLMFSATLPKNIMTLSQQYMNDPVRISAGEVNVVAKNIKQEVIRIDQSRKYEELTSQLEERQGSVIVFVKTKHSADKMAMHLRRDGFTSEALHGDLRQTKREKVMKNFHKMNFRILIATDIAARGLDVPHIQHVINYDLPQVAEDYIHRMGRTARAGAEGSAISFVSNQDGRKWHAIECLLDPNKAANDRGSDRRPNNSSKRKRPSRNGGDFGSKFEGKRSDKPRGKFSGKPGGKPDSKPARRDDRSEGKSFEGKKFDGKRSEGRSFEGKKFDGKRSEGKSFEGKKFDGKRSEGKSFEGKKFDGKRSEGKSFEGKKFDGKRSEGKSFEGKKFDGKRSEGKGSGYKGGANKSGAPYKKSFTGPKKRAA